MTNNYDEDEGGELHPFNILLDWSDEVKEEFVNIWREMRGETKEDQQSVAGNILNWLFYNIDGMLERFSSYTFVNEDMFIVEDITFQLLAKDFWDTINNMVVNITEDPKEFDIKVRHFALMHLKQTPEIGTAYMMDVRNKFHLLQYDFFDHAENSRPHILWYQFWDHVVNAFIKESSKFHGMLSFSEAKKQKKSCCNLL